MPRTVAYSLAATVSQPLTGPHAGASPSTRTDSRYDATTSPPRARSVMAAPQRPRGMSVVIYFAAAAAAASISFPSSVALRSPT